MAQKELYSISNTASILTLAKKIWNCNNNFLTSIIKSPTLVLIFHGVNLIVPAPARTLNSYNVTGFCSISKTAHKNNSYVLSSLNKNRHLEYANILHISCIGYRRLITWRFIFRLLLFYLFSGDIKFFFQMYFLRGYSDVIGFVDIIITWLLERYNYGGIGVSRKVYIRLLSPWTVVCSSQGFKMRIL